MRPEELYYSTDVLYTSNNLSILSSSFYSHIPEIPDFFSNYNKIDRSRNILVKYYADEKIGKRRKWILASVWFKDTPIMIIQNGGNEGDEISKKFVTDIDAYNDMIKYININLKKVGIDSENNVRNFFVSEDEEIPNLDSFGGYSLDSFINKE